MPRLRFSRCTKRPGCNSRDAVGLASHPCKAAEQRRGSYTPVVPSPYCQLRRRRCVAPPQVYPREPGFRPAPGPTEALLRSTHWSGRPSNHLVQQVKRLYPGGRAVPVSRKTQHAAELERRYWLVRPARNPSAGQARWFLEFVLIVRSGRGDNFWRLPCQAHVGSPTRVPRGHRDQRRAGV